MPREPSCECQGNPAVNASSLQKAVRRPHSRVGYGLLLETHPIRPPSTMPKLKQGCELSRAGEGGLRGCRGLLVTGSVLL